MSATGNRGVVLEEVQGEQGEKREIEAGASMHVPSPQSLISSRNLSLLDSPYSTKTSLFLTSCLAVRLATGLVDVLRLQFFQR